MLIDLTVGAVEVREAGPSDGPLVVLLHGWPQTTACWDGVLPVLGDAGLRAVAPAQRGYSPGARPSGRAAYATDALVGDVLELADRLGAERFGVVGHDWGGLLAWVLAARHPERLTGAVVVSTPHPAALRTVALRSAQLLRSAYIAGFQLPALPERALLAGGGAVLRTLLVRSGLPSATAEAYVAAMREPGALTAGLNWYRGAAPSLAGLGPSRSPTLYAWGSGDPALGRAAAEATARFVEAPYRFEVLEGAGHWLPENEAPRLAELTLQHLDA